MFRKYIPILICLSIFIAANTALYAQPPGWTIDLLGKSKKPEKFENKKLGSEKTADKKFTLPRRFIQNNITRYNFHFNANNKLNEVVERARIALKDDYTRLMTFYPYDLENTAGQAGDLDSVIQKCTAGILLHDLRNEWVDNLYLIIGKAYFLRKDFDSASMTFQFINYNMFPRKKGEDDSRVVGTRESASGSSISIANTEKRNILQKVFGKPPSRNESLIWMVRTLTEQGDYGEAAGLVNTLQNDPNMPKRLQPDLEEVTAYLFYKQSVYDSAAVHLEKALNNAENKQDKSRWEFLLAQLLEMTGKYDKASDYYARASRHTVDPLMDIFARLNDAKMLRRGDNANELNKSISNLLHMARKDKFETYRDIIYYSAAQIALQKPDTTEALAYFRKSLKYNDGSNVSYKNKVFIQLGDIAFDRREYRDAYAWYDSIQSGDTTLAARIEEIQARRNALSKIVAKLVIVEKEDSLQRIAAMPAAERDTYIKKIVKKLRKESGLKEEDGGSGTLVSFDNEKNKPADLFDAGSKSGTWYFYNSSLKSKGFNEFKSTWGERINVDNWRRKAAVQGQLSPGIPGDGGYSGTQTAPKLNAEDITTEGLMANLPLTPEKLAASHALLSVNLYELGKLYQDELEDYPQAITTYDLSLERYPDSLYNGELYLNLFYCYSKLGDKAKAAYYKNLLTNGKLAGTRAAKMVTNPGAVNPNVKIPAATKAYENIYNLFIEGSFDEALRQKKAADSLYGRNYWSPQLLYIEAMYYVKQRNDSTAHLVLSDIINLYPKSPLKDKAQNLIDVLKRRKEIEEYLTKLEITRMKEDAPIKVDSGAVAATRQVQQQGPVVIRPKDSTLTQPVIVMPKDSTVKQPVILPAPVKDSVKKAPQLTLGPFAMDTAAAHYVLMILDKVDPVYVNEAKNAFVRYSREGYRAVPLEVNKDTLDKDRNLLVFSKFDNAGAALQYCDKLKRVAPSEVSWLPAAKYSFLIITDDNLLRLKTNKDLINYKILLNKQFPGKF